MWFIEAKLTSDISKRTIARPERDQVLRNIDVGSYYSGSSKFFFALLIRDSAASPKGVGMVEQYRDFGIVRTKLLHREDGLQNLIGVGLLYWSDLVDIFQDARSQTVRGDEAVFAERAIQWLQTRHITGTSHNERPVLR